MAFNIGHDEKIVTAFAEHLSGPGWTNAPVWVIVRNRLHELRQECIQICDQTDEMMYLFNVSKAAHESMTQAVENARKSK